MERTGCVWRAQWELGLHVLWLLGPVRPSVPLVLFTEPFLTIAVLLLMRWRKPLLLHKQRASGGRGGLLEHNLAKEEATSRLH